MKRYEVVFKQPYPLDPALAEIFSDAWEEVTCETLAESEDEVRKKAAEVKPDAELISVKLLSDIPPLDLDQLPF